MSIPRAEHPNPQWQRERWQTLNGWWEFELDPGKSGRDRSLYESERLSRRILVPFCPESALSGIGEKDFMPCVWYRRTVEVSCLKNHRAILHFGAVDYEAWVYVNGQLAGKHRGGYTPFSFDITDLLRPGENTLAVCAEDDSRVLFRARGKQSDRYDSWGCDYTRTTGIWQTVWLEYVPEAHIVSARYFPDIHSPALAVQAVVAGSGTLQVTARYQGVEMGSVSVPTTGGTVCATLPLKERHLWELGHGRLYDLELSFGEDKVSSYFGLRSVGLSGMKFLLNDQSVFQRLVLDQGFYPDGIYTAPEEEIFVRDIELGLAAGFNGARPHEKVFEPRFLYHCDKMGYMVWGEHAAWYIDLSDQRTLGLFLPEWMEAVQRDFNHPSIVCWCPLNETWDVDGRKQLDATVETLYDLTKVMDTTRPCIDASGHYHIKTDIFDVHDYEQDTEIFAARYQKFLRENILEEKFSERQTWGGQPCFVSEYGGIKWSVDGDKNGWGYGDGPATEEEFLQRYENLTAVLLDNEKISGFCYTQLYDVEQEANGLYTYGREPKFDMDRIKKINTRKAACETE